VIRSKGAPRHEFSPLLPPEYRTKVQYILYSENTILFGFTKFLQLGYELNPSLFGLRNPQDVFDVALAGTPIAEVETNPSWRYYLHFSIGRLLL